MSKKMFYSLQISPEKSDKMRTHVFVREMIREIKNFANKNKYSKASKILLFRKLSTKSKRS